MKSLFLGSLLFSLSLLGIWLLPGQEKPTRSTAKSSQPKPPAKIGNPSFLSPHFRPITLHRDHLFVVNTPADTVDVIDTTTGRFLKRIPVGIDR